MSETTSDAALTVVLVHGAFADSSSWDGVIERLQAAGIPVTAAPNPWASWTVGVQSTERPVRCACARASKETR